MPLTHQGQGMPDFREWELRNFNLFSPNFCLLDLWVGFKIHGILTNLSFKKISVGKHDEPKFLSVRYIRKGKMDVGCQRWESSFWFNVADLGEECVFVFFFFLWPEFWLETVTVLRVIYIFIWATISNLNSIMRSFHLRVIMASFFFWQSY